VTWPPPETSRPTVPSRPWEPQSPLRPDLGRRNPSRLRYVVVEEVLGEQIGLSASRWPDADEKGRLRFDLSHAPQEISVARSELESFLSGAWGPGQGPLEGGIRVGTTFAAEVKSEQAAPTPELNRWLANPCDITPEARRVAKLAYYAAITPTLRPADAGEWGLNELAE
jgi:hypothetical protein